MGKRDITKLNFDEMQTVEECIECATVDAYSEWEATSGWLTCIEEIFEGISQAKLCGEPVRLTGFDVRGTEIVACCRKGRHRVSVTLDSLGFDELTAVQKLWLKAWKKWQKENG